MEITKTKILAYRRRLQEGLFPTGEHRYLARNLPKNHNSKKHCNQNQSSRNLGGSTNRPKIRIHLKPLSNLNANIKNNIARSNDLVKTNTFSSVKTEEKPGEIKIWANQPAERFPHISERTLNKDSLSFLDNLIIFNLSKNPVSVNGNN